MRVLGIDPSLRSTGYAVVEGDRSRQTAIDFGVIRTRTGQSLDESLATISQALERILLDHAPECLAIEDIFTHKNSRTALLLGHVRGVIMETCRRSGLASSHYNATRIKETVAGYGRASKEQVQVMVTTTLGLKQVPQSDAADALATAITHLVWSSAPERELTAGNPRGKNK